MSKAEEFVKVMEKHQGKRNLVIIRGAPDPDSIGSAMAHEYLLKDYDIEVDIVYKQTLSHQENKALVNKLDIDMTLFSDNEELKEEEIPFTTWSLVDTNNTEVPWIKNIKDCPLLSIVDHHKKAQNYDSGEFNDIRDDVGSTCAIYTEYIKELKPLSVEDEVHSTLATALLYGIRTDTDNYMDACEADFEAIKYLSEFADKELLKSISSQLMSPVTMNIVQKALENKKVANTFLISCVGFIRKEDRDAIPQAADFLLRREGIETVLVYGIINNCIDGSLRTRSSTIDPHSFIKDTFPILDTNGEYGGRKNKGGFKIPLGFLSDYKNSEELEMIISNHMEEKVYNKIGFELKKEDSK